MMTTEFSDYFCAAYPSVFGQAVFIGVGCIELPFEVLFSLLDYEKMIAAF